MKYQQRLSFIVVCVGLAFSTHASYLKHITLTTGLKIRNCIETIKYLPPFYPPQQEIEKFHEAVIKGDVRKTGQMLARTPKLINARWGDRTPLLTAISIRRSHIAHFLTEKGADVNATDQVGQAAIHIAAGQGDYQLCKKLISHNADVKKRDTYNRTPVLLAVQNGAQGDPVSTTYVLVKAGADVNQPDYKGDVPLGSISLMSPNDARSNKSNRVMHILIQSGANVQHANNNGERPIHIHSKLLSPKNVQTIVQLLQKNEKYVDRPVSCHSVYALDNQGRSAMQYVARSNQHYWAHPTDIKRVVTCLKKAGLDHNGRDNEGQSPLHHAGSLRQTKVGLVLVECGANPRLPGKLGKTPIDLENEWVVAQTEFDESPVVT